MQGVTFLLGILVLFFALWFVGGGPNRSVSFQGPYLTPVRTTGDTSDAYGGARAPGSPGLLADWLGEGGSPIAVGNASPSRGTVTLARSTAGAWADDPEDEYLIIRLSASANANVSITGWKLSSESSGTSVSIPGGTETFRSGALNGTAPITLRPGDEAIVTSGRSPVGASFRENICTGYLDALQDFVPPLETDCPSPLDEYDDADLNDRECETFLRSIPYCTTATRVPSSLSSSCERLAEDRLTHNGCVAAHSSEADFSLPIWRIYLGERKALWDDDRDTIHLLDSSGKIVDVLSY